MFPQHDPDGAMLFRDSGFFHLRKKKVFFFAVMTSVSKDPEKLHDAFQVARVHPFSRIDFRAYLFQNSKHEQNALVFFPQLLRRGHGLASCLVNGKRSSLAFFLPVSPRRIKFPGSSIQR
jgi:hypothetical protein